MRHWALCGLVVAGCASGGKSEVADDALLPGDTGDTDLVADTDRADTDANDTDVADTDRADTDGTDTAALGVGLPAFCPAPAGDTDVGGAGEPALPRTITSATGDTLAVIDGLSAFDFRLFAQTNPSANTVISPLSVSVALAMTWEGAEGATETELANALGITIPAADWRTSLVDLLADVEGTSRTTGAHVNLANQLFGDASFGWRQDFTDRCRDDWGAPFRALSFAPDPDPARLQINDWARRQTCGLIPSLFAQGALSPDTPLVLANALLVEADWSTVFDESATASGDFHLAGGGTRSVEFMNAELTLASTRPGSFTVAQLPLDGEELGFWVIVPDAADGLPAIEAAWTPSAFAGWTAAATQTRVDLFFPKFQQRTTKDMVAPLQAMGVSTLFDSLQANLSGMTDAADPLWVSQIAHQAVIVFDERGLRAAAATGVAFVTDTASAPPPELRVDRPFLFVLRDELTGLILFMGRTVDPT